MNDVYSTKGSFAPLVAGVFFELIGTKLHVILLKSPSSHTWVLPRGPIQRQESSLDALYRTCLQTAGMRLDKDIKYIEQLYTFDVNANHSPQLVVAYSGYSRNIAWHKSNTEVLPINFSELPKKMGSFERTVLTYAYERLLSKLTYTTAIYAFLPKDFTLSELQSAYEAIFDKQFDKRNFRKKYLALDTIEETGATKKTTSKRPAQLYRFKSHSLTILPRPFV